MPFIPDTAWGLAYLAGLCLAGLAAWAWPSREARRVALVMGLHWLAMRAIDVTAPDSPLAWVCHDMALILWLAIWGRSRLAYAVAALFLPVTLLDQVWLVWGSTFEANAAAAEAAGYLAFLMIMGAAYGGTGTGHRLRGPSHLRALPADRHGYRLPAVADGGTISRRAVLSGTGVAGRPKPRKTMGAR